jgi:acyl transferase domain-containing protein
LEAAWHALEHAGHSPESFKGLIGVFASMDIPRYLLHMIGMGESWHGSNLGYTLAE